jgi:hypothetical protein
MKSLHCVHQLIIIFIGVPQISRTQRSFNQVYRNPPLPHPSPRMP